MDVCQVGHMIKRHALNSFNTAHTSCHRQKHILTVALASQNLQKIQFHCESDVMHMEVV